MRNYQAYLVKLLTELEPPGNMKRFIGVEVGVAVGALSKVLLEAFPGLILVMVDSWQEHGPETPYRQTGDKRSRMTEHVQLQRMAEAIKNTDFAWNRRRILRLSSVDAANLLIKENGDGRNGCLDFSFIDASHAYPDVKKDMDTWYPLVKPGGLYAGHDYRHHKYKGVEQAVDEFFNNRELLYKEKLNLGTDGAESVWWTLKTTQDL